VGLCLVKQLEKLLCEPVGGTFSSFNHRYVLTRHTARFVDRDMFMRYRGGGIGHQYMREIEEIYENMARERIHHKERGRASANTPADADAANDSGSDDECEPNVPTNAQAPEAVGDNDNDDNDDSELDDSDYEPPGTDSGGSGSSGKSDTDDFDSEGEVLESYGFGDL